MIFKLGTGRLVVLPTCPLSLAIMHKEALENFLYQ
jgi:hypothetical protein